MLVELMTQMPGGMKLPGMKLPGMKLPGMRQADRQHLGNRYGH